MQVAGYTFGKLFCNLENLGGIIFLGPADKQKNTSLICGRLGGVMRLVLVPVGTSQNANRIPPFVANANAHTKPAVVVDPRAL